MELSRIFLAGLAEGSRAALQAHDDLDETLRAIVASARETWPGIDLEPQPFLHYFAKRLPEPTLEALVGLNTDDLYLSCACGLGNARALALLDLLEDGQVLGDG